MHEPIMPVGSNGHSITGNITADSFFKLVQSQQRDLPAEYRLDTSSVFLDIGSGMGRPVLCMGTLPVCMSLGIEVQRSQLEISWLALKKARALLMAPVLLQHCDVLAVSSLEPVTHVHMFLWVNPQLLRHTVSLLAWSDSIKVATVVHRGTLADLRRLGMLSGGEAKEDDVYTRRVSVKMPGGSSYAAYILCMTPERRQRMRKLIGKPKATPASFPFTASIMDLAQSLSKQAQDTQHLEHQIATTGITLRSQRILGNK